MTTTFDPSDDAPLSPARPVSLSAAALASWAEASVVAGASVWYRPAVDSPPPRLRHCRLCLLGLEEEAAGGVAATWSRGGNVGGGGCGGGGGDPASARRRGPGSRRRRRRMRRGEEAEEE